MGLRERLVRSEPVDYQVERSNSKWVEHELRKDVTGALIAWINPDSVLDPACGDGSVVTAALRFQPIKTIYLSDISQPNIDQLSVAAGLRLALAGAHIACMSIEDMLTTFTGHVDVIILTEILEHVDDPDWILRLARERSRYLVASSPEMRPGQYDDNEEHLWMFDREGYREMLVDAGWKVQQYTHLGFQSTYDFQIWCCS